MVCYLDKNMSVERHALLVTGMHRSGTSALTRVLSLCGANLPEKLLPSMEGVNDKGFWESATLVDLHEELLKSAGSSWMDWSAFNQDWYQSATAKRFHKRILAYLQQDFADSDLFILKEPRICRFLPFWLDVLDAFKAQPVIIIPIRHPLEVAYSLEKRDAIPIQKGVLLWLRHVLEVVYHSGHAQRAFVSYDDLLIDWKSVVNSITAQTGVYFPRQSPEVDIEVDSYVDKRHRNNMVEPDSIQLGSEFHSMIGDVYAALVRLVDEQGQCEKSLSLLTDTYHDFNKTASWYSKLCLFEEKRFQESIQVGEVINEERTQLEVRLNASEITRAQLDSQLEDSESVRAGLESRLEESESVRAGLESRLEESESVRAGLESRLEESESVRAGLESRLEESESVRAGLESRLEESESVRADLESRLEESESVRADIDIRLSNSDAQCADLQATLKQATKEIERLLYTGDYLRGLVKSGLEGNKHLETHVVQRLHGEVASADNRKRYWGVTRQQPSGLLGWVSERKKLAKECSLITRSGLLDEGFYFAQYSDSAEHSQSAIVHYLEEGSAKGLDPSPLFSTAGYLSNNGDVHKSGINPLLHFVQYGYREGRTFHPLFDVEYYARQRSGVRNGEAANPLQHYLQRGYKEHLEPCPLFDGRWYASTCDLPEDIPPLVHFISRDVDEAVQPHLLFWADYFLNTYPQVKESGINPLIFYLRYGAKWHYSPHPLFDSVYYTQSVDRLSMSTPLADFLWVGANNDVSPSPLFDVQWYTEQYPEVEKMGVNPLVHYLQQGSEQGYWPNPLFDPSWYRCEYQNEEDVAVEPLVDFVLSGYKQGRNPNPWFDCQWYAERDFLLKEKQMNPLAHYLLFGGKEGRDTHLEVKISAYVDVHPGMRDSALTPLGYYIHIINKDKN